MDDPTFAQQLADHAQHIEALKENQFALVAQVQVLQAALASALLHQADRAAILATFEQMMAKAKASAPSMADRLAMLETGIAGLLGKQAP